jgi:hypothetical protein
MEEKRMRVKSAEQAGNPRVARKRSAGEYYTLRN